MRADHTDAPAGCEYATICVVFELSKAKWQLGVMPVQDITPGRSRHHQNVQTNKRRAGFPAVKAATRRLRRWPAASLDRGYTWRRGHPLDERGITRAARAHIITEAKPCLDQIIPLDNYVLIQVRISVATCGSTCPGCRCALPGYLASSRHRPQGAGTAASSRSPWRHRPRRGDRRSARRLSSETCGVRTLWRDPRHRDG